MDSDNNQGGIAPEFNNAASETHLQTEFNEAASETHLRTEFNEAAKGDDSSLTGVREASSGESQADANHDLEPDLHSLGGIQDDPELVNYQSFADELDASEADQGSDAEAFQEFKKEQETKDANQESNGPQPSYKNDPGLSM